MRTTNSVTFYCRPSKANRQGLSPIEVSIILNGKRTFINLPRKETPTTFQKELKKKTSDLTDYLFQIRTKLNEIQTELLKNNIPVTTDTIREYLKTGGIKTYTLQDMWTEYLNILKLRVNRNLTERAYEKYIITENEFLNYFGKNREATTITSADILKYYNNLGTQFQVGTTAGKMTRVKSVFRFAFDSGKINTFPFNSIRIKRPNNLIEYLTYEEIDRLKNIDLKERYDRTRDLFLFQMSTGLSFADLLNLKKEDIEVQNETQIIKKRRQKTGVEFTSVILPEGIRILKKYDYKLPLLSNQKYNQNLKEIEKKISIDKNLHSHLARKTYATLMLNSGVNISVVSKLLGHSNTNITQKYYAKLNDTTVINEVKSKIK